jgi:hypothetical protein
MQGAGKQQQAERKDRHAHALHHGPHDRYIMIVDLKMKKNLHPSLHKK